MNNSMIIEMLKQFQACIEHDIKGIKKARAKALCAFGKELVGEHNLSLIAEGQKRINEVNEAIGFLENKNET